MEGSAQESFSFWSFNQITDGVEETGIVTIYVTPVNYTYHLH
jgi:hypothetical protein